MSDKSLEKKESTEKILDTDRELTTLALRVLKENMEMIDTSHDALAEQLLKLTLAEQQNIVDTFASPDLAKQIKERQDQSQKKGETYTLTKKDLKMCVSNFFTDYVEARLANDNSEQKDGVNLIGGKAKRNTLQLVMLFLLPLGYRDGFNSYANKLYHCIYVTKQKTKLDFNFNLNAGAVDKGEKGKTISNSYSTKYKSTPASQRDENLNTDINKVIKEKKGLLQSSGPIRKRKKDGSVMTYCSQTTQVDAEMHFKTIIPTGNAFDAMQKNSSYKMSLISEYYTKRYPKGIGDGAKKSDNKTMSNSASINNLLGEEGKNLRFADVFVKSNTTNGKKYGHRCLMYQENKKRFVLDPYVNKHNGAVPVEQYSKGGKRIFMKMNFYS